MWEVSHAEPHGSTLQKLCLPYVGAWEPGTQLEQLRLYLLGHRAEVAYSFTLCKVVLRKGGGKSQLTG